MNAIVDFCAIYEPAPACLHELFELQAARTPDATAVVFANQQLSYRELNEQANQLARHLRMCGVGPEVLVGIYLERSLSLVVGLLAILKAGGAYVPLDPTYPQERLAYMVHDSRLAVLLTQKSLLEKLPTELEKTAHVISLDQDWPVINRESTGNLERFALPMNPSYIIYTSGSTGQPKGVMIQHANAVAFVCWAMSVFSRDELAGTLASTSICFDFSIFEIFVPLSCGGTVLLIENILYLSAASFANKVTLVCSVPSALSELIQIHPLPSSVRCVNVGGEPFPAILAQRLYQQETIQRIYNLYGPSETTTCSTAALIERSDSRTPSLGQPIAHTQIYIVDRQMNLVPRGMVGEIYIGGVGVARGYLGRPELTAQRFVPDPFSCQAGAVLYKTGDLARYRADGAIEFLGREDHQVKIRGFRIELGEIAEALRQYPGVREVALAVLNDKADQKYLVAYIVPQPACELTPDALRSMLRQRLPAYMVPSLFLLLDALPRFPNGKIDYSKLTALDIGSEQNREVALPRNEVEEMLLDIWREVLALEYVGIHDPFLDLGGHSLQALRILLRVQETFRITMSYAAFLQHPTLAEQATYILEHKRSTPVQQQPEPTMQRYTTYGDVFPLSFGQQQLWLIDQLGSQSLAYNVPIEFHLRGALDLTVFRRCLQEIVDRHEVLRTTIFPDANGRPVQAIKPAIQIDLPLIDLRALTDNARKQEMHHLTRQAARISFDLTQGPLLHTRLVQLADDEHVLLLTMHHIIVDDWSLEICQQELAQLYQDFVHGRAPSLAALPIRYADFALWQHKWLDSAHAGQQFAYWRQQLSDPPDMVRLPTDHSRPAQPTFQGAREDSVLPDLLTQQLKQLSHHEGVTLYILLLCAFKIFLYRYTGQCDIIVGSASAGRQYPEVAHLLGFFANMLALRTQLSPDLTFLDALQRVHETVLEANAHQEIPFGQLVERLQPRRNLGSTPLFEVTFALQHASKPVSMGPDLLLEMNENDSDQVQFAVEVLFVEREGELSCSFKYATELYEAVAIRRMMQNFQCLLESIVAQPQHHLSDLPLLAEIERKQVLFAWNATHSPLSEPHCLHDLFEQQVARTPEAIAVTSGDQQLSYQELNERANQLAHSLRTLGCAPEVPVGLYLERSLYLMIGVLGVLKAGGAYLPLDPTYPRERLAWILADAQVPILLTQTTLLSHLPEHNSTVVCLDDMMARYNQSGLTGTSTTNPLPLTTDMHLAYIIYTSGSTGQPKGVLVTHRSVVNHSLAIAKQYALHCSDRVLQFASLSFDAAGEEIYPTWLSGATLVLRPEHLPATPDALHSYILRTGLTVLNLPTAYWHQWVTDPAMPSEPLPTSLRLVIVGGEQVQSNSYRHWLRSAGTQIQWSNTYGPTEATITAILHVPEGYEEPHLDPPPIGRPIANVQAYVLDQQLQPVPIGAIGEIYLGGTGLARGYLNRPDLTAECFIPNPYGPAGTRLYRTGDRARYLTDGNLLYVSRGDRQVKIRGYRIELAEVESHLLRHPAVSECVVVARADALGATSLIAYIITRQAHVSTASLRQFLGTHLPAYALPTNYVFLEHFPRTASGKIDQRALPVPGLNHQENTAAYVPPETPVEEVLVNLWCEVLKLSHVGIHDHFLELGGHSLLAMQIAFRVHQIFRIEIPLHMFFQVLTVAKLAEHITLLGRECGIDVVKIAQLMIKINAFSDTEVKALLAESNDLDRLS